VIVREPERVRAMFGRIAARYDNANTVLSFGRDAAWRRAAAMATGLGPGQTALDIACGTGRLAIELSKLVGPEGHITGVDFNREMLRVAARQSRGIAWIDADALSLPFADQTFDATTMAFGLRNLADPGAGAVEMARVVRAGGHLVVLEFVRPPRRLAGAAYTFYLRNVLPIVGGWITGDRASYHYLSETIDAFLTPHQLVDLCRGAGWSKVSVTSLNLGMVALLAGVRA